MYVVNHAMQGSATERGLDFTRLIHFSFFNPAELFKKHFDF